MVYLSSSHRRMLELESGIAPNVIAQRGYRTITDPAELEALGFAPSQRRPGLLIPQHTTANVQRGDMLRPDNPRTDDRGKIIKYEAPAGSTPMLDCPPGVETLLRDPTVPLDFTEGAKKADAAASRGLACVSLNGVYGFLSRKVVIPDFDDIALAGRRVRLIFDSDVTVKREVKDALDRLAGALWRRGANVEIVTLPPGPDGEKVGLDDYFAAGGTVAGLDALTAPWRHAEPAPLPAVAEADQWRSDFRTLSRMVLNPNLTRAELTTYVATYHEIKCATPAEPGGPVVLSAGQIANDFRAKPATGEHLPPTNKNGERPRLNRKQVKPILETAMERGLLAFSWQRPLRSPRGRDAYRDRDYIFTPPANFTEWGVAASTWTPDEPKPRKPRRILDPCRYCGEVHPIERVSTCTGCGSIVDVKIIVPEPAHGSMGHDLSPIEEGAMSHESPAVVAPSSPPPSNDIGHDLSPIATVAEPIDLAPAQTALTRASHATGQDFHHAKADLDAALTSIGRANGRAAPKPNAPPAYDRWDTLPPPGAAP